MVLEVNRLPMEQGLARRAGSTGVVRLEGTVRADRGPVIPPTTGHPVRGSLGAPPSAGDNNLLQSRHTPVMWDQRHTSIRGSVVRRPCIGEHVEGGSVGHGYGRDRDVGGGGPGGAAAGHQFRSRVQNRPGTRAEEATVRTGPIVQVAAVSAGGDPERPVVRRRPETRVDCACPHHRNSSRPRHCGGYRGLLRELGALPSAGYNNLLQSRHSPVM